MITEKELKEICKDYEIDYEQLIKNEKVLRYGDYNEIISTLEFLKEIEIEVKKIEKCPSILYLSTENIKSNWDFLKRSEITISNIENCLHVLSTEHEQMKNTYKYVMENYGRSYLNKQTSILHVNVKRIQEIERRFKEDLKKENFLQAAISKFSIKEIEKIVETCNKNEIEITGSVFRQTAEEIEKIVETCNKNEIEITGSVFFKTAEEIEKIVEICNKNEIEITGSVFLKTAEEIEKFVNDIAIFKRKRSDRYSYNKSIYFKFNII